MIARTDANGRTTTMSYDADRRLVTTTAPAPFNAGLSLVQTTNRYDPDGHLLSVSHRNGTSNVVTGMSYTATGKVQAVTDPNGHVTTNTYDADDRLASVTDPLSRVTTYGYDAMSRRISVSNFAIQPGPLLQQTYTPDGLVGSLTDANNHTTTFAPDGFDRLSTTTYPGGSTEVLSYDADGNVLGRQTRAGATIAFTYDTLNRVSTKAAPSEPSITYSYDLAGHVIGVSDSSPAITTPSASASYVTNLSYDQLNHPVSVTWNPAPAQATPAAMSAGFAFGYDADNRRISQSASDNSWWDYPTVATSVSYTANSLNQYTAVGAVTPAYDANGNLTSEGTFTYGYDAENRLTSASGPGIVASYAYDAQGRRKSKTVNGATTIFVTDAGNREVLEYDGTTGVIKNWYAYGLGPNEVLNQVNGAGTTRATLIPDIQGSIVGSLDANSGVLTKNGYQSYGESGSTAGSFRYTGQRIDPETNGLYYDRARMYMPAWGRFMQVDPIGYAAGANLYAYIDNDPLNQTDPSGRCPACVGAVVGAGAGLLFQASSDLWNWRLSSGSIYAGAVIGDAVGGAAATVCGPACAGAAAGAASNLITGALNGNVSPGSIAIGATIGAVTGGVAGQVIPAAFKSFVSTSVKGDIGEALSYMSVKLGGGSVEQTSAPNGVGKSTFDFLLSNGGFVESKFGTGQLSGPQRAAAAIQGNNLNVQYWDYPTVSGMFGAGLAGSSTSGALK